MTEYCDDCGEYVNLFSESETYDIIQYDDGNIGYICENCYNKEIKE